MHLKFLKTVEQCINMCLNPYILEGIQTHDLLLFMQMRRSPCHTTKATFKRNQIFCLPNLMRHIPTLVVDFGEFLCKPFCVLKNLKESSKKGVCITYRHTYVGLIICNILTASSHA
jgi:hypothetical protein